jgi:hypothetical protein
MYQTGQNGCGQCSELLPCVPFEQSGVSSTMTSLQQYEDEQYRGVALGLSASEKKMLGRVDMLAI